MEYIYVGAILTLLHIFIISLVFYVTRRTSPAGVPSIILVVGVIIWFVAFYVSFYTLGKPMKYETFAERYEDDAEVIWADLSEDDVVTVMRVGDERIYVNFGDLPEKQRKKIQTMLNHGSTSGQRLIIRRTNQGPEINYKDPPIQEPKE